MRHFDINGSAFIISHTLVPEWRTHYLWHILQINNNNKLYKLSGDLLLEEDLMISFIPPHSTFKISPSQLGFVAEPCDNLITRKRKETLSEFATKYSNSDLGAQICLELLKDFPITSKVTYFEICSR